MWAIVGFVFSMTGLIGLPVAVVCGIVGLQKASQGQGGRPLAITALVLSTLWVVLLAGTLVFYLVLVYSSESRPSASPQLGDCFSELPRDVRAPADAIVDCSELHVAEVFAVATWPEEEFPDTAEIGAWCNSQLAAELSADAPGVSGVGFFVPSRAQWRDGNRTVACVVTLDPPLSGPVEGLRTAAMAFYKIGDCLGERSATKPEIPLLDCAELHVGEVFAQFMVPDGRFPGTATIQEYRDRCEPELQTYAPATADDPSITVTSSYPDGVSWRAGHRAVTCIATLDPPRTGSLRG